MKNQGCVGKVRRSLLIGFAVAAIGGGYTNTTHAGVIAKADIDLWPAYPVFQCLYGFDGFEPCGGVRAVLAGEDTLQSWRGDVTFGGPWTVEARAGGSSGSSYSYGLLDRTLHFELTNPYEREARFGLDSSHAVDYTFGFSDLTVTDSGDYGRITNDFFYYSNTGVDSGVWECTNLPCYRPSKYSLSPGSWYPQGATLAPGETYAFSVRAIVTAEARAADVPEPGALSMLALALAGLGFITRRHQPTV